MDKLNPSARWTVTQPWRGLFAFVVTVAFVWAVTAIFDMKSYLGFYTILIMSFVPMILMIGLGWRGQYPPTNGIPQPFRGLLLTAFVVLWGTYVAYIITNFMYRGASHPVVALYTISTVIMMFFLIVAFGMWPFQKLSVGASGFLSLILGYVLAWFLTRLFNFSLLSFPAGVNPSPVNPVPFYAQGGPLAPLAAYAPTGPFAWEAGITFWFWMVVWLFVFINLMMWPINKSPTLMKQPLMGVVITVLCFVLTLISYAIGVWTIKIEPLHFMLYGILWLFGVLMIMTIFQMWPGRNLKQPAWGFVNILLGILVGIIGYYMYKAFAMWHFGEAMKYPNDIFTLANMMLGMTFPAWAIYTDVWDHWPMPPTPPPPGPPEGGSPPPSAPLR
jgi:hypothetical protein